MKFTVTIGTAFILFISAFKLLNAQSVQGPQNPSGTANIQCSFSYTSTLHLAPAANVSASDNVYATASHCACCDANTSCLQVDNFGFSIPLSATITGIMVEIEKHASNGAMIQDNGLKLLKNGAEAGSNNAQFGVNWPTTDTYTTYGNSTSLWGTTWTPAEINAGNFGLVFASIDYSCSGIQISYIDHVRVTVYYNACTTSVAANYSHTVSGPAASFTDLSSNATSWLWDFGDGNTSTLQNPVHNYTSPGIYNVCLVASDTCGGDTVCMPVEICGPLDAGFDITHTPVGANFSDTSQNATNWFWDFGDGNSATQQNPSHTYLSAGTYYVCLIVSNNCTSDTICDSVIICDLPVADFNHLSNGTLVNYTDISQYATYWQWDFGDGNTSALQSPAHTYSAPGTYTVCLIAGNSCFEDTICHSVTVQSTGVEGFDLFVATIYPNPAKDVVYVAFPDDFPVEGLEIMLYDNLGKAITLKSIAWNSVIASLDISGLASGPYYVRISGKGVSLAHRLILKR